MMKMSYKSPIEIATDLSNAFMLEIENEVVKAVYNVGVKVDKDELIRALTYDRKQYEAGFADGVAVKPSPKDFIPIKWIEEYCAKQAENDKIDCYWTCFEDDVLEMIELWKRSKENEAKTNGCR